MAGIAVQSFARRREPPPSLGFFTCVLDVTLVSAVFFALVVSGHALAVTNATIRYTYIAVLGGLCLVVLLAAYLTRTRISRPIKNIVAVLEELAKENFEAAIGGTHRADEVGDIARAALVFRERIPGCDAPRCECQPGPQWLEPTCLP